MLAREVVDGNRILWAASPPNGEWPTRFLPAERIRLHGRNRYVAARHLSALHQRAWVLTSRYGENVQPEGTLARSWRRRFQERRDTIRPYGGPDNYIDYLVGKRAL